MLAKFTFPTVVSCSTLRIGQHLFYIEKFSTRFKSPYRSTLNGKLDGGLDIEGPINAGLEGQLKKLSSECDNASDLNIDYYATDMPDKNPTNLKDLVKLIQEFPSRLAKINEGQGVPIQVFEYLFNSIYHNKLSFFVI